MTLQANLKTNRIIDAQTGKEVTSQKLTEQVLNTTVTKTATGDIASDERVVLADTTGGAITLTLPLVASAPNEFFYVKKVDAAANTVTVEGNGSETIDGAANQALTGQFDSITLFSDGTEWHIFD